MCTSSLLDLQSLLTIAFSCCKQNSEIALWVSGESECLGFHFFVPCDYSRYLQGAATCICSQHFPIKTAWSVYHWSYLLLHEPEIQALHSFFGYLWGQLLLCGRFMWEKCLGIGFVFFGIDYPAWHNIFQIILVQTIHFDSLLGVFINNIIIISILC